MTREARGIRLNNPGNIRHSKAKWQGAADDQPDPEFVKYKTPEHGIRAMGRILLQYRKRDLDTIGEIISTWAPPSENNTAAYVKAVCAGCGLGPDDAVDIDNVEIMRPLVKAIIKHENGKQPYSDATIDAGLRLAGIANAKPPPLVKDKAVIGSALTTTSVAAAGVKEVSDNIEWLQEALAPLAGYLPTITGVIVVLGLIGVAVGLYQRIKERRA